MSPKKMLNKTNFDYLSNELGKSDKEIVDFFNISQSYLDFLKERNCFDTSKEGERFALKKLKAVGFLVENMNDLTTHYPYDLLVENRVKIDVKSSKVLKSKYSEVFEFALADSTTNKTLLSDSRIMLPSEKKKRKLFRKVCDFLLLVGICKNDQKFYIVPTEDIPDTLTKIGIPVEPSRSKYRKYENRWDLINQKLQCTEGKVMSKNGQAAFQRGNHSPAV